VSDARPASPPRVTADRKSRAAGKPRANSKPAVRGQEPPGPPAAALHDARASGLRYVSPESPGYSRRRTGRGFAYLDADGKSIRTPGELARIRALAIPPAWTEVWICPWADGHIQAIGRDARGRRQYRYHAAFRARRDDGKFARLMRFGERLPQIRRRVRADLRRPGLPREKVLGTVVSLLEATRLRVGNAEYARLNKSFGVSTLRARHARVTATTLHLRFRGKGGRVEERRLVDRRLARVVRRCQELPGQELFQYLDEAGEARAISSEDVNAYLREAAGSDEISAKDFRTWTATMLAFRLLRDGVADGGTRAPAFDTSAGTRTGASTGVQRASAAGDSPAPRPRRRVNPIIEALRQTAEELGDTLAVTRSSYVHPGVIEAFENGADPETTGPVRTAGTGPASPAPRRASSGGSDRAEELELLALLRRSYRSSRRKAAGGAARRSQVGGARGAERSSRPAA
jgi:DNA topoisomerase-1